MGTKPAGIFAIEIPFCEMEKANSFKKRYKWSKSAIAFRYLIRGKKC